MEILLNFVWHLIYVILCLIFVWCAKSWYINYLYNNINKIPKKAKSISKTKKKTPDRVYIININNVGYPFFPSSPTAYINWVEKEIVANNITIRVVDSSKEDDIESSILICLKIEEIPFLFSLNLIWLLFLYKIIPSAIRSNDLNIKANKRMIAKMKEILQLNNIYQFNSDNAKKITWLEIKT